MICVLIRYIHIISTGESIRVPHPWFVRVRVLTFPRPELPFVRNPLNRYYGQRDLHFITFSCYARRPYLDTPSARNKFLQILDEVRSRHQFQLLGYVIMPEHVHLLVSESQTGDPSTSMQMLKQAVSRRMKLRREAPSPKTSSVHSSRGDPQAFWQRRFYDFNVWRSKKLQVKLDYMHGNPVQHRLVHHPADWPGSSWSHYEKGERGLIPVDPLFEEPSLPPSAHPESQNPHP
jgi:putative transposase